MPNLQTFLTTMYPSPTMRSLKAQSDFQDGGESNNNLIAASLKNELSGLCAIYKPKGLSSAAVVAKIKFTLENYFQEKLKQKCKIKVSITLRLWNFNKVFIIEGWSWWYIGPTCRGSSSSWNQWRYKGNDQISLWFKRVLCCRKTRHCNRQVRII